MLYGVMHKLRKSGSRWKNTFLDGVYIEGVRESVPLTKRECDSWRIGNTVSCYLVHTEYSICLNLKSLKQIFSKNDDKKALVHVSLGCVRALEDDVHYFLIKLLCI